MPRSQVNSRPQDGGVACEHVDAHVHLWYAVPLHKVLAADGHSL